MSASSASGSDLAQLKIRQLAIQDQTKEIEARLGRLEQTISKLTGVDALANKRPKKDVTNKAATSPQPTTNKPSAKSAASPSNSASPTASPTPAELPSDDDPSHWWDVNTYTVDKEGVVPHLSSVCTAAGLTKFRFYRVANTYYDWTLEQRRDVLGAPSIVHLCKSVVMTNTHFKEPVTEGNQKYILVIVSYAEKLHKEKLNSAVYEHYKRLTPNALSKRQYDANWRLADNDEAIAMTGYNHNAMVPIGMKTNFLIVLSKTILGLETGSFYLGGGEVDVKLRLSVKQFVNAYKPIVAEITTA